MDSPRNMQSYRSYTINIKTMALLLSAFLPITLWGRNQELMKRLLHSVLLNYDVTFPMMAKISVKGKNIAPLYQWLTEKKLNGVQDAPVQWNFQKFMIDENGNWVGMVPPKESPFSETIVQWIEKK